MEYQHDRHRVHFIVYLLIFCPTYRRGILVGPVKKRLEAIIDDVMCEQGWQLIELAIQPDHVPLFVRTNPSPPPSDVPRLIKGCSSRVLRKEFVHLRKLPTLWTP
jgi:putative transposase